MMLSRKTTTRTVHAFAAVSSTLLLASVASAQERYGIQAYGGYSMFHPNSPSFDSRPVLSRTVESPLGNLSGWNGGITVGLNKHFGFTTDFSRYCKRFTDESDCGATGGAYTLLVGPQVQKNGEQLRPFARALFGVGHALVKTTGDASLAKRSRAASAASVGGGLDVKVADRVAIRVAQLDYFPFRISKGGGLTFNNFRLGAGLVFHLR